jgi:hypothetical protein
MACKSCGSRTQTELGAEINIHFPVPKGLKMPSVLVFPKLMICLNCGFAEFTIAETVLRLLTEGVVS